MLEGSVEVGFQLESSEFFLMAALAGHKLGSSATPVVHFTRIFNDRVWMGIVFNGRLGVSL